MSENIQGKLSSNEKGGETCCCFFKFHTKVTTKKKATNGKSPSIFQPPTRRKILSSEVCVSFFVGIRLQECFSKCKRLVSANGWLVAIALPRWKLYQNERYQYGSNFWLAMIDSYEINVGKCCHTSGQFVFGKPECFFWRGVIPCSDQKG